MILSRGLVKDNDGREKSRFRVTWLGKNAERGVGQTFEIVTNQRSTFGKARKMLISRGTVLGELYKKEDGEKEGIY